MAHGASEVLLLCFLFIVTCSQEGFTDHVVSYTDAGINILILEHILNFYFLLGMTGLDENVTE